MIPEDFGLYRGMRQIRKNLVRQPGPAPGHRVDDPSPARPPRAREMLTAGSNTHLATQEDMPPRPQAITQLTPSAGPRSLADEELSRPGRPTTKAPGHPPLKAGRTADSFPRAGQPRGTPPQSHRVPPWFPPANPPSFPLLAHPGCARFCGIPPNPEQPPLHTETSLTGAPSLTAGDPGRTREHPVATCLS
jgi:hypothetical protein